MTRHTLLCALWLLLPGAAISAQQQTGAPAGIPLPAPPTSGTIAAAQDTAQSLHFRIRAVDGRNGSPIRNAHIRLWYDEPVGSGYQLATDPEGYSNMPAPIGEPVRVLAAVIDYANCRHSFRDDPPIGYNLQTIKAMGMAAQNGCEKIAVHTKPGELILFMRPARWYEGLNRNAGN